MSLILTTCVPSQPYSGTSIMRSTPCAAAVCKQRQHTFEGALGWYPNRFEDRKRLVRGRLVAGSRHAQGRRGFNRPSTVASRGSVEGTDENASRMCGAATIVSIAASGGKAQAMSWR